MTSLLIDSHGDVWSSKSREVRSAYDSPYSGGEFSTYAIKNLGFIHVYTFGTSCQVSFRPNVVSRTAIAACLEWTRRQGFVRYVLDLRNCDARMDLLASHADLAKAIERVVSQQQSIAATDFLAEPQGKVLPPPIVNLLDALRDRPFDLSNLDQTRMLSVLVKETFGNRYLIARADENRSKLVFDKIGDGLFSPFADWRGSAIGTAIEALPDPAFGEWAANTYNRAIDEQTPIFDTVDAVVCWPRLGRVRLRYKRSVLPFVDSSGTPMLITGSVADTSIDLRIKSA